MKKFFLNGPFFPKHNDNLMNCEGDVDYAREKFLKYRFRNLDFLLRKRHEWMNDYIDGDVIIELGAGAGFSELYLNSKIILTDATNKPWIKSYIDATQMDLKDSSVDVIIISHTIHHLYSPYKFFKECERVLKKNGVIIIQEIHTSLLMRIILRIMRHEGWSYNVNVFNPDEIINDKNDLWSANTAAAELLFENEKEFEKNFSLLKVEKNEFCECLIYPLSGGVISKIKMPEFPLWFLNIVNMIDKILVKISPNTFALGRNVIVRKK